MSYTDEEIREDYLSKIKKVFTGNGGILTRDMCNAAEMRSIKNNPAASMQRRIERVFTDPSGKKKSVVFVNRPRIIKTFKEEKKNYDRNKKNVSTRDKGGVLFIYEPPISTHTVRR